MMTAEVNNQKYDRVTIEYPEGLKSFKPEEFRAIPLVDRIKLLCQGQVKFYKNDVPVQATEALKAARI